MDATIRNTYNAVEGQVRINIQVGEVKYPLIVNAEEEPIFREAARMISERVRRYSQKYRAANLPHEFFMAFAAVDIAARLVKLQKETNTEAEEAILEAINAELKSFLEQ